MVTPKPCRLVHWVLEEVLLRLLDLVALAVGSVAALEGLRVVEVSEEVSEVIDLTFVVEEAVSGIKAVEALVEEVGMVADHLMGTVMAQHHPLMHLLDREEEVALVVGMAVLL